LSNPTPAVGNAYSYSDRFTKCDDFTDSDAERDGQPERDCNSGDT
jgi:hypothetical protein